MANEKENNNETLSLSELGLKSEETPAEKAAANNEGSDTQTATTATNEDPNTQIVTTDTGLQVEVHKVDMSTIKDDDEPPKKKRNIPRPIPRTDGNNDEPEHHFNIIKDVNKIAKVKLPKYEDPGQKKMKELSDLADKGIVRTEKELTAPNGRIQEGKEKYIEHRYETLMKRAESSENLAKKIKFYENAMASDPSFDDISDYERKGYILYKVAHDDTIGITDKSFGLSKESIRKVRKTSADTAKDLNNVTEEMPDMSDDGDSTIVLGKTDEKKLEALKKEVPKKEEEVKEEEPDIEVDVSVEEPVVKEDEEVELPVVHDDEDVEIPLEDNSPVEPEPIVGDTTPDLVSDLLVPEDNAAEEAIRTTNEELDEQSEIMQRYGLTSSEIDEIANNYYKDASAMLGIADTTEIDNMFGDSTNGDDISLNSALRIYLNQHPEARNPVRTIWPLMATGKPIVSTALSGQELSQFLEDINNGFFENGQFKEEPDIEKVKSIFNALYRHYVNPGGLSFGAWLRSIFASDMADLIFSQYNALFSHNNFMSFQCQKKGCVKLYLEKKKIMDMVVFNDDEAKKRFTAICKKESVGSDLTHTPPVPINDTFAFSFKSPSIYSMYFERASVSENDRKKYSSVIGLLPVLDSVYILDHRNKKKSRINFGVDPKSLENTTLRKIKGLMRILTTFNTDQRAKLLSEYLKIIKDMNKTYISYQIPGSKCPSCGTVIPPEPTNPFSALFTRARLSTDVASSRALL